MLQLLSSECIPGRFLAHSPFAGTWKLDTAKTQFATGEPPKELTFVIDETR
jgi:hypothetical protein